MKRSLLALMMLATPLGVPAADAGNEGPVGAPVPGSSVVAEVHTYGGLMPAPRRDHGVRVYASGLVISFVGTYGSDGRTESTEDVAMLSSTTLYRIQSAACGVTPGELVDYDRGTPVCMDAPSTSYRSVVRGQLVEIARRSGCHEYGLEDGSGESLKEFLDGLSRIAYAAADAAGG